MKITPFHLAVGVRDLEEAANFYGEKLGFARGRSSQNWIDWNMYGHQFVTHLSTYNSLSSKNQDYSYVDSHRVPIPHFGVVLEFAHWYDLAEKVKALINNIIIEPYIRFKGDAGEQGTMFFLDPSGNALEFKAFKNIEKDLFAKSSIIKTKQIITQTK